MAKPQDGSPARWTGSGLWQFLILTLLLGAGIVYLDNQDFDWKQNLAVLRERASESPPVKQADLQNQPSGLSPSFDVAYADETGKLVTAGRGAAGWIIRLANKTQTLGDTIVDKRGEWVLTPEQPLAPGEHTLSLLAIDPLSQRSVSGQQSITLSIAPRREKPMLFIEETARSEKLATTAK
jgi:hypothetical protein